MKNFYKARNPILRKHGRRGSGAAVLKNTSDSDILERDSSRRRSVDLNLQALNSAVHSESPRIGWSIAFEEAARAEEEGGRELRLFVDELDKRSVVPSEESPHAEQDCDLVEYGAFRQPSLLSRFVRSELSS